jgi:hypothetical protein
MSPVLLHLMNSMHMWVVFVAFLSGCALFALGMYVGPATDGAGWHKEHVATATVASAVVFFVATSLAIFLPTTEKMERAKQSARVAAKYAWCTEHPGACK